MKLDLREKNRENLDKVSAVCYTTFILSYSKKVVWMGKNTHRIEGFV